MPDSLYQKTIDQIEFLYGEKICDRQTNICKINKSCKSISREKRDDLKIYFELDDEISTYKFEMVFDDIFNSGIYFGDSATE